jgi:uncharacterized membrane protein
MMSSTATPGHKPLRYAPYALCALVFLLAWVAKLSLYDTPQPSLTNPVSATKLWVSPQTAEPHQAGVAALPSALVVLFLTYFSYLLFRCAEQHPVTLEARAMAQDSRAALYRCLRPPPAS